MPAVAVTAVPRRRSVYSGPVRVWEPWYMLDVNASVDAAVDPASVFAVVSDLGTYPRWLDIVGRAEETEPTVGPRQRRDGDDASAEANPAWLIDLRAQLGPLRRSKRLRMERTVCDPDSMARFERRELDGRSHSDWILTATISEAPRGTRLTMNLFYGGSLWLPALDKVLQQEIRRSSRRLVAMVEGDDIA